MCTYTCTHTHTHTHTHTYIYIISCFALPPCNHIATHYSVHYSISLISTVQYVAVCDITVSYCSMLSQTNRHWTSLEVKTKQRDTIQSLTRGWGGSNASDTPTQPTRIANAHTPLQRLDNTTVKMQIITGLCKLSKNVYYQRDYYSTCIPCEYHQHQCSFIKDLDSDSILNCIFNTVMVILTTHKDYKHHHSHHLGQ